MISKLIQEEPIGETIRKLRLNSNKNSLSQLELSYAIGWENPSTLSRIESSQVIPSRETILKISRALSLDKERINTLLKRLNYSEFEPELTDKYINKLIKKVEDEFDDYEYPISLKLFGSNLYLNKSSKKILSKIIDINIDEYMKDHLYLEIFLDPIFNLRKYVVDFEESATIFIGNYYFMTKSFLNSEQIENEIKPLRKYADFNKIWEKVLKSKDLEFTSYNIPLNFNLPHIGEIKFFVWENIFFEDKRFYIEHMIPFNKEDIENY